MITEDKMRGSKLLSITQSYLQVIELDHGKLSYVGDHTQYEKESQFYKNFLENLANNTEDGDEVTEEIPRKESVIDKVNVQAQFFTLMAI